MVEMEELRKKVKSVGGKFRKIRNYDNRAYFYIKNVDGKLITNHNYTHIICINAMLFSSDYTQWRLRKGLI